jgi:hypothetical protein
MPHFKCPKCHRKFYSYERHPECPTCKKRDVTTNNMSCYDEPEERSMFSPTIDDTCTSDSTPFEGGGGDFGGGGSSGSF